MNDSRIINDRYNSKKHYSEQRGTRSPLGEQTEKFFDSLLEEKIAEDKSVENEWRAKKILTVIADEVEQALDDGAEFSPELLGINERYAELDSLSKEDFEIFVDAKLDYIFALKACYYLNFDDEVSRSSREHYDNIIQEYTKDDKSAANFKHVLEVVNFIIEEDEELQLLGGYIDPTPKQRYEELFELEPEEYAKTMEILRLNNALSIEKAKEISEIATKDWQKNAVQDFFWTNQGGYNHFYLYDAKEVGDDGTVLREDSIDPVIEIIKNGTALDAVKHKFGNELGSEAYEKEQSRIHDSYRNSGENTLIREKKRHAQETTLQHIIAASILDPTLLEQRTAAEEFNTFGKYNFSDHTAYPTIPGALKLYEKALENYMARNEEQTPPTVKQEGTQQALGGETPGAQLDKKAI